MRFDKLTIKSQELIQNAQSLAARYGNQQIAKEHLLLAMLEEKEGMARTVLRKLGASPEAVCDAARTAVDRLPKVSGASEVYLSADTRAVIEKAFDEAAKMKDEYVSIEHILLVLADAAGGEAAAILKRHGVNRDNLLKVLMEIRGSQRITDPNPEEKYQALEKFSRDLTELARTGQAGSGDRPRRRDAAHRPGALAPDQEQSRADR